MYRDIEDEDDDYLLSDSPLWVFQMYRVDIDLMICWGLR